MQKNRLAGFILSALLSLAALHPAWLIAAQDGTETPEWKAEFERICSQTKSAVSMEPESLAKLLEESEKLRDRLKKLDDPGAKIYVFRLERCKDFFEYAQALQQEE